MPRSLLQKGISIILRRQTNILSAAIIIMATVIFSQLLGLVRQRLLVSIFGASNTLGVYLASGRLPDFLFQLIIAGALTSAFIPVFSDYLAKGKEKEAHKMASSLLLVGLTIFSLVAIILFIFAPFFLRLINLGSGFSSDQMDLMANLMRIILVGQLLFIIGSFLSALLQSYNHFFIPGMAGALYNLGIIIGIIFLSKLIGIYAAAVGIVFGSLFFIGAQLPMVKNVGFSFHPQFSLKHSGVLAVSRLMWPRTLSIAVFQMGSIITVSLISFLSAPGRQYVIFDYAQTLAFAPVALFGQTIAQAAFPVLAREKDKLEDFKRTFITSFTQMFYLILPASVLLLVLRVPVVRLIYGAPQFDWVATILTGRTLAAFSISITSQALVYLVARGFYALHDTKIPLLVGAFSTLLMLTLGAVFVIGGNFGVESIAWAYSFASLFQLVVLFFFLERRVGGFPKSLLLPSLGKITLATICTGFAIYIPVKLLDQLVFDTARTINLILLSGISASAGLFLYLFLTWFLSVKEATPFLLLFKRIGNWQEVLGKNKEVIETTRI